MHFRLLLVRDTGGDAMVEFGPLLRTAQRVFANLSLTEFLNLPDPVLPVHVDVINDRLAVHVMASVAGDDSGVDALRLVQAQGFRVRTFTGRVASGWTYFENLATLADTDGEAYLDAAGVVRPELDVSVPEAWNAPPGAAAGGLTGRGTLIGIVDSGIDVTHASFQTAWGNTRVCRLWDQSVQGVNPRPGLYAYGSEWTDAEIDRHVLAGSPFPSVDTTGHGTAVAGIAAANGFAIPTRRYVGVAPEAELIVVKLDARSHAFASTGNVVDAVDYVFEVAAQLGRRAVVNLSQGARLGPHDGLGELERGLDDLLRRDADRIVVNSAGNLADANAHARVYVPMGGFVDLVVQVPAYAGPYLAVELWYDVSDRISVQVIDPSGSPGQLISGSNSRGFGAPVQ